MGGLNTRTPQATLLKTSDSNTERYVNLIIFRISHQMFMFSINSLVAHHTTVTYSAKLHEILIKTLFQQYDIYIFYHYDCLVVLHACAYHDVVLLS